MLKSKQGGVMRISKAWLSWSDFYELNITDEQNELLCLCVALAIDRINAGAQTAASTSNGAS